MDHIECQSSNDEQHLIDVISESRVNCPQSSSSKAITLFKTSIIESNNSYFLETTNEAIQAFSQNFDPAKRFVIICNAGISGIGKSTWLNSILYATSKTTTAPFEIGDAQNSQTEGIWNYPFPLKIEDHEDVQILLLDMEGLGNIRENMNSSTAAKLSQKLFILGMAFSSVFCIHTQLPLQIEEIDRLKNTFDILKTLKDQWGISLPKIYIFIKDVNEIKLSKNGKSFMETLEQSYQIPKDLISQLTIIPRGRIPDEEFYNTHDFTLLDGSTYRQKIQEFLKDVVHYPKMSSGLQQQHLSSKELIELLKTLEMNINSNDFERNFLSRNQDGMLELAHSKLYEMINAFSTYSFDQAMLCPLDKTEEEFDGFILEEKGRYIKTFKKFVKEKFDQEDTVSLVLQKTAALIEDGLRISVAKTIFMQRKIDNEKNQEIKQYLQDMRKEYELVDHENKEQNKLLNLQLNKLKNEHQQELRKKKAEYDQNLAGLKKQCLEELRRQKAESAQIEAESTKNLIELRRQKAESDQKDIECKKNLEELKLLKAERAQREIKYKQNLEELEMRKAEAVAKNLEYAALLEENTKLFEENENFCDDYEKLFEEYQKLKLEL